MVDFPIDDNMDQDAEIAAMQKTLSELTELYGMELGMDGVEDAAGCDDEEIEQMQRKVEEMEHEAEKLKQVTAAGDVPMTDPLEADKRSIYVGNVDYGTAPEELQEHFKRCGTITRITILVDKVTGHQKGYAYVEFQEESAVANAVLLNDSLFRNRQLKVMAKRTNVPFFHFSSKGGKGAVKGGKGKGKGKGFDSYKGGYGYQAYPGPFRPRYRPAAYRPY